LFLPVVVFVFVVFFCAAPGDKFVEAIPLVSLSPLFLFVVLPGAVPLAAIFGSTGRSPVVSEPTAFGARLLTAANLMTS